jgi:hypothetical protein
MRERSIGRIRIFHNGRTARIEFDARKLLRVPPELYASVTTLHHTVCHGRVRKCGAATKSQARELRVELNTRRREQTAQAG